MNGMYYGIAKLQSVWSFFLTHSPTVTFSRETESVSLDNKMAAEDLETESYEQVEPPNILPLAPKQANPHNVDSAHCSRGTNSTSSKDMAQPKSHSHAQSKAQQKRHPPPAADSLEEIYECPNWGLLTFTYLLYKLLHIVLTLYVISIVHKAGTLVTLSARET